MTAWTLALETVATAGSVALLQGDTLHSERQLPPAARSARTLTAVIQDLWNVAGKPKIQLIGVASGPGSFTGLRVGITTAKTLAFAWNAKLIGINTLEAIADQIEPVAGWLHVALDAQRKELFLARFCADGKGWRREASDTIITLQSWLESLANSTPSHPIAVAGPALVKLQDRLPAQAIVSDSTAWHARAGTVGRLAFQAYQAGQADELWSLVPHYLRASYAEEKRPATAD